MRSATLAWPRNWRCGPAIGPPGPEVDHHREARSAPALGSCRSSRSPGQPREPSHSSVRAGLPCEGLPPCSTAPLPPSPTSIPRSGPAIQRENRRQEEHIELIASENYASPAVMAAQGSQLTNKYAEGYPGKRYYGGCEFVDVVEQLAIDRVKQLFGAELRQRAGRIPARRPTRRCSSACCSRATRSWA